jgi:hypothetical protein
MIINRILKFRIFCCCSLFPSWSGYGLNSTPVLRWSGVSGRCMNEYGASAEWYWDGKCKVLGEVLSQRRFVHHKSDIVGWDLWWIWWYQERFSSTIWFFSFRYLSLHRVHSTITDAISVIDSIIKFCLKEIYCTESISSVFKDKLQNKFE